MKAGAEAAAVVVVVVATVAIASGPQNYPRAAMERKKGKKRKKGRKNQETLFRPLT